MPVNGGGNGHGTDFGTTGAAGGVPSGVSGQQQPGGWGAGSGAGTDASWGSADTGSWGSADTGSWGTGGRNPADIVSDPVQGDQTSAGLPLRVPKANLIPGSAPGTRDGVGTGAASRLGGTSNEQPTLSAPLPQRSPDLARSRLSGFQRGARRAESQPPRAGEGTDR
jgi:hypothetical protein